MTNLDVFSSKYAYDVFKMKYSLDGKETWLDTCNRVTFNVMSAVGYDENHPLTIEMRDLIYNRKFLPGGRYLRSAGRPTPQIKSCIGFSVEDSAEDWAETMKKVSLSLMHGLGCGVEYSKCREEGAPLKRKGGYASGPISLMHMIDNITAWVMSGGDRRGANLAQLSWRHPDILKFIAAKNWDKETIERLEKDWAAYAPLKYTNLSVRVGDRFLEALDNGDPYALMIFDTVCRQMCRTGEPGFICNFGDKKNEMITNACSEYRSDKDSASCNLVSVNWAKIKDIEEFNHVVGMASLFAIAGNQYSYYPTEESKQVVKEDNDIGVGIMGIAEWFIQRGYAYGEESDELLEWLDVWSENVEMVRPFCERLGLPVPKRARAVAPTGSISILSETSGGIEPIFLVAYKRKVLKGGVTMMSDYVIDPVAKRLIDNGVSPDKVEDSYSIPYERRIAFQALVQDHCDMAVSSTINMPKWGSEGNNEETVEEFKRVVRKYLPRLRGITAFPDGGRGSAQPMTPVKYSTAIKYAGRGLVEDSIQVCDLTKGGTCGG